jgi:hypothetical protein
METNLEKAKRLLIDHAAISGIELKGNEYLFEMLKLAYTPDVVNKNDLLHDVSVSLPDAEIITWLRKQKYQTEIGEQEYRMYFDVDMPKIIRAAIAHFSSGNER